MKLIVGLGNPGDEYNNTRHNIGFSLVDYYLDNVNYKSKFKGLYYKSADNVIFLKPQTFMNNSGFSVKDFVDYFKIDIDDILVIQDDLDLDIGKIRFKCNSSSGGHNGIKSIINSLNTNSFLRLKIGINYKKNIDTVDYVLGNFSKEEKEFFDYNYMKQAINDFILYGKDYVMNKYNRR